MTESNVFNILLSGVFIFAIISFVLLFFVSAPYGRHQVKGWGPVIPTRLAWVLMESPACLLFFYFFFTGKNSFAIVPLILLAMWQLHYFHRAFIYPFQIRIKSGATMPVFVMLSGSFYCAINGYLNGTYIGSYASHLNNDWLLDPRFIIGLLVFALGYYMNKKSDAILRGLRENKPRKCKYE